MEQHSIQEMPLDPIAVGATRPSVVKGLDIPLGFLPVALVPPFIVAWVTFNPFWLFAIAGMILVIRRVVKNDHNRPRVLWLRFMSGAMFAPRDALWGGQTTDPLANGDRPYHGP